MLTENILNICEVQNTFKKDIFIEICKSKSILLPIFNFYSSQWIEHTKKKTDLKKNIYSPTYHFWTVFFTLPFVSFFNKELSKY